MRLFEIQQKTEILNDDEIKIIQKLKSDKPLSTQEQAEINKTKEKLISLIQEKCQPFLQSRSKGEYLYRGTSSSLFVYITSPREDRKPKHSSETVDMIIEKKLSAAQISARRSNSFFTSPLSFDARSYGKVYIAFPIGDFDFSWSSKFRDLYTDLNAIDVEYFFKSFFLQNTDSYIRWKVYDHLLENNPNAHFTKIINLLRQHHQKESEKGYDDSTLRMIVYTAFDRQIPHISNTLMFKSILETIPPQAFKDMLGLKTHQDSSLSEAIAKENEILIKGPILLIDEYLFDYLGIVI